MLENESLLLNRLHASSITILNNNKLIKYRGIL